ncbi:hypothetical protein [Bradyrhizobium japonicum]|nr:hypothetical protein [Bradyrhizobium japonicum]
MGLITCHNDDCVGPSIHGATFDEAMAFWNTRAQNHLPGDAEIERYCRPEFEKWAEGRLTGCFRRAYGKITINNFKEWKLRDSLGYREDDLQVSWLAFKEAWLSSNAWVRRRINLPEAQAVSQAEREILDQLAANVREQVSDGDGMWATCSGCHESVDGYSIGYLRSKIFGCTLGSGCSECGGIGAVWDSTDYGHLADETHAEMVAEEAAATPGLPQSAKESVGTFACDICGKDTPHAHDLKEVEIERYARPAFETVLAKWLNMYIPPERRRRGEMLGIVGWELKPPRNPGRDSPNYIDRWVEALWVFWLEAWTAKQSWHTAFDKAAGEPQEVKVPEKAFELTPFMIKLLKLAWSDGRITLANDMTLRHAEMAAMREMAEHGFVIPVEEDRSLPGPSRPPVWVITDKGLDAASSALTGDRT